MSRRHNYFKKTRKPSKKGLFGGKIAHHKDIKALNQSIIAKEKAELEVFEAHFNSQLKNL